MKYPKYGTWCKQNVIETIKKQKINSSEKYLKEFVLNPNSDLYSTGVYDFEVYDILCSINDELNNPPLSLFSVVQHGFAEKYFHMAQEMNPETDMKVIRYNGDGYTDLLFRALDGMSVDDVEKKLRETIFDRMDKKLAMQIG